jgi:hypothetical protein
MVALSSLRIHWTTLCEFTAFKISLWQQIILFLDLITLCSSTHNIGLDLYWLKHKSIEVLYLLQIHVYHCHILFIFNISANCPMNEFMWCIHYMEGGHNLSWTFLYKGTWVKWFQKYWKFYLEIKFIMMHCLEVEFHI